MVQHYFVSAWLLPEGLPRTIALDGVDIGSGVADCYRAATITPSRHSHPALASRSKPSCSSAPAGEDAGNAEPGLELVKDYGWLTIIAKPLYWLLDKLHGVIQNWGWAIVALVLLKVAFYWLNEKGYASMAKMKAINPKIMEMRERLKDNPQQMQQEMMRIYRGKGQPHGRLLPHHDPDPGVHRAVLGAAVHRGNARCTVGAVDP